MALTDDDLRTYHVGMSEGMAVAAYCGMIEHGEVSMDRLQGLIPERLLELVKHYFATKDASKPQRASRSHRCVADEATVQRYAKQHAELVAMLENLMEFVSTMPAPNENAIIPGVDYGYVGDVGRIHEFVKQASDIAYEMSE